MGVADVVSFSCRRPTVEGGRPREIDGARRLRPRAEPTSHNVGRRGDRRVAFATPPLRPPNRCGSPDWRRGRADPGDQSRAKMYACICSSYEEGMTPARYGRGIARAWRRGSSPGRDDVSRRDLEETATYFFLPGAFGEGGEGPRLFFSFFLSPPAIQSERDDARGGTHVVGRVNPASHPTLPHPLAATLPAPRRRRRPLPSGPAARPAREIE